MSKLRIKINLSNFFQDHRSQSYILIKKDWETVKCLQKHVERLFSLSNIVFLTEDSIYLHPKETIDVIQENDVLIVIKDGEAQDDEQQELPPPQVKKKEFRKTKILADDGNSFSNERISKSRNRTMYGLLPNAENNVLSEEKNSKKKLKQIVDFHDKISPQKKIVINPFSKLDVSAPDDCPEEKKRKRVRKRKTKKANEAPKKFEKPVVQANYKVQINPTPYEFKKHFRFDDEGNKLECLENSSNKKESKQIVFQNYLDEANSTSPRIIQAVVLKPKELSTNLPYENGASNLGQNSRIDAANESKPTTVNGHDNCNGENIQSEEKIMSQE